MEYRAGEMKDRSDAGQVGCRTGLMRDRSDAGQGDAGQVEYRRGGMQSCRISRIQDIWDAGQVGCRTIRIQKR